MWAYNLKNEQISRSVQALLAIISIKPPMDRPALDKTGLTGTYDIKLTYTPDIRSNREGEPEPNDLTIPQAVQDQLGLKLESQKAMVEILVVDHVEKPSAN